MRFSEKLFFPPWTAHLGVRDGTAAGGTGAALIARVDGDPAWTISTQSSREGLAHVSSWEVIRGILGDESAIQTIDISLLETIAGQPEDQPRARLVAVASDRLEVVLRAALAARRMGVPFFDWAARISVMRQVHEQLADWVLPGEMMPWAGLRRILERLLRCSRLVPRSAPQGASVRDEWIRNLTRRCLAPTRTSASDSETVDASVLLCACTQNANSAEDARAQFLWSAAVELGAVGPECLGARELEQLAAETTRRHSTLGPHFRCAAAREGRLMDVFERVVDRVPETGWVGISLYHGLCDGHIIGWRREAALRAVALANRVKAPSAWLVVQRLSLALALGQVKTFSDHWDESFDHSTRVGALWAVLRAWMPIIDAGLLPQVPAEAATVWLRAVDAMLSSPSADAATSHMAAMGEIYLGSPGTIGESVNRLVQRGLNVPQVAALVILAWLRREEELAADLWTRHCCDHQPAAIRELAPVAIARSLVTRELGTGAWLDRVEREDPAFFDAVVPSNTRCFFFALAWQALGNKAKTTSWFARAVDQDPSASVRRSLWERAALHSNGACA